MTTALLSLLGEVTPEFITAQLIGFLGAAIVIVSFQFKSVKALLFLQICSSFVFATQFFIMGAYTGMASNILGAILRIFVFSKEKKWIKILPWKWFISAIFVSFGIILYDTWYSLIPSVAMVAYTLAVWTADPKKIRFYGASFVTPLWFIYNVCVISLPGIITETFVFISIIVSWMRFYSKKALKVKAAE